jgi:hypothetical protein
MSKKHISKQQKTEAPKSSAPQTIGLFDKLITIMKIFKNNI